MFLGFTIVRAIYFTAVLGGHASQGQGIADARPPGQVGSAWIRLNPRDALEALPKASNPRNIFRDPTEKAKWYLSLVLYSLVLMASA